MRDRSSPPGPRSPRGLAQPAGFPATAVLAAAVLLAAPTIDAQEDRLPDFKPNEEYPLPWHNLQDDLRVFVPADYRPDTRWPVLFWFHGTGGAPDLTFIRRCTGDKGFILVGMTYIDYDSVIGFVESEIANVEAVRARLSAGLNIDPARTYVGGFSRGGWYAGFFADYAMDRLAGVILLGAGIKEYTRPKISASTLGKPIYIGVGESDPNYAQAVRAMLHHRRLRHRVTFDVLEGMGHALPDGDRAKGITDWLTVEALRNQPDALAASREQWTSAARQSLATIKDPLKRHAFVESALLGPWAPHLPADVRQGLERARTALEADPAVRTERDARRALHNLLDPGWEKLTRDQRQKLEDSLRNLAGAFPDTPSAATAERLIPEIWRMESIVNRTNQPG